MPYCRVCGIEVGSTTTYCPDCGEELNFGSTEAVEATPEPDEEETTVEETGTVEPETEPEPTIETEPESEEKGVSIWAKIGVVIAIPISLVGLFLEIASVYTLSIGEYTLGQFVLMSIIFGLVAFLPIAYIYWMYKRSTWSVKGVLS
ncbi:hypothetical protein [Haloprofundus halobius]|uniref:hypothetical protein n=1 Tax=Haloprofundus halobius TaxID=2876194 RepID=UPI001CCF5AF6|nr:hypothetical protein [Haloprofundus halobius]